MLKRHEGQGLRRAGRTWNEIAALSGVSLPTARRMRLTDDDRRKLAARVYRLDRQAPSCAYRSTRDDANLDVGLDLESAHHGPEGDDFEVGLVQRQIELLTAAHGLGARLQHPGHAVQRQIAGQIVAAVRAPLDGARQEARLRMPGAGPDLLADF